MVDFGVVVVILDRGEGEWRPLVLDQRSEGAGGLIAGILLRDDRFDFRLGIGSGRRKERVNTNTQ